MVGKGSTRDGDNICFGNQAFRFSFTKITFGGIFIDDPEFFCRFFYSGNKGKMSYHGNSLVFPLFNDQFSGIELDAGAFIDFEKGDANPYQLDVARVADLNPGVRIWTKSPEFCEREGHHERVSSILLTAKHFVLFKFRVFVIHFLANHPTTAYAGSLTTDYGSPSHLRLLLGT